MMMTMTATFSLNKLNSTNISSIKCQKHSKKHNRKRKTIEQKLLFLTTHTQKENNIND